MSLYSDIERPRGGRMLWWILNAFCNNFELQMAGEKVVVERGKYVLPVTIG